MHKQTNERTNGRQSVNAQQLTYTRHQAPYAITVGNEFVRIDKGENENA